MSDETITIPLLEYEELKTAKSERDEYWRVCRLSPKKLDAAFDRILKGQEETKRIQDEVSKLLERLTKKVNHE